MRQTLGFIAVWFGATVMAISIAWFGVRDVLHSGVFADARIGPLGTADDRNGAAPPPSWPSSGPAEPVGAPTPSPSVTGTASPGPAATGQEPGTGDPAPSRGPADSPPSTHPVASAEPTQRTTSAPRPRQTASMPSPVQTTSAPRPMQSTTAPRPMQTTAVPKAAQTTSAPKPTQTAQDVQVVKTKGGTVSFTIRNGACQLVSAVPNAGYQTKVAQNDGWIRVDLVQGEHGSAAFCIGHENRTDIWEY
ncbi:hypothetical protein [Planobispora rosea]|nr:hypothetical protein [Planobispora rosea]